MLLAITFNLITFSVYLDDLLGQMFALFVLTNAAAESAIGLAILQFIRRNQCIHSCRRISWLMKGSSIVSESSVVSGLPLPFLLRIYIS